MTNKEMQIIKNEIFHYLCDDWENNQAIFDRGSGYAIFNGTDLTMIVDKVVHGLKSAQNIINKKSTISESLEK